MFKSLFGRKGSPKELGELDLLPSINAPYRIAITGFERADESAHMFEWLGKGQDFRRFVVADLEAELYLQTPGAQLLAAECTAAPDLRTSGIQDAPGGPVVVTGLSVTFPIMARVKTSDGAIWKLDIHHNYDARNLNLPGRQELTFNFGLKSSSQE